MDSLLTNRLDPALLRVVDKHGTERDTTPRRRRPPGSERLEPPEENNAEPDQHELDDLA